MSFRKEFKFRVTNSDLISIKKRLLSDRMSVLYPSRRVNSIYFDTKNLKMFTDSEEGTLPRKKIRLRWYNDDENKSFEEKISALEGRFKKTKNFNFLVKKLDRLSFLDPDYGTIIPSLKITYNRKYYSYKNLRITFDQEIEYQRVRGIVHLSKKDKECVIEIKAPHNVSTDYVSSILLNPTERFSKYARGIISTYHIF